MNINISIKHIGQAVGTIGWLAENADHILIGPSKHGKLGAWLKGKDGANLTILALLGDDGIEVVDRQPGAYSLSCDFIATDAAWNIIEQLAEMAREAMREPQELAAGYRVSVAAASAEVEK